MDAKERKIFRLEASRRMQGGLIALESWVKLAELVLDKVEERVEKRQPTQLEQWLNRMFSYQGWITCDNQKSHTQRYTS